MIINVKFKMKFMTFYNGVTELVIKLKGEVQLKAGIKLNRRE